MKLRELVCIGCPLGCRLKVQINDDNEVLSVEGNTCPRGEAYARKEVTNPTRIVTTTVGIENSTSGTIRLPVKTRTDIPKSRIHACVKDLKNVSVSAPISIGDTVKENIANTGVDIVATRNVE